MRILSWYFRPALWPSLATALLFPGLLGLGFWQLDRAEQKRAMFADFQKQQNAAPINLNQISVKHSNFATMNWRKVKLTGQFYPNMDILLDNQVWQSRVGYLVFTPFKLLEEDVWVLVNRGWTPLPGDRRRVPEIMQIAAATEITGIAKKPPSSGLSLAETTFEHLAGNVTRVQKIELEKIEQLIGHKLLPYVIRLNPDPASGLVQQQLTPGVGKEKHIAYAFQWFALAIVLLIIYLALNLSTDTEGNK